MTASTLAPQSLCTELKKDIIAYLNSEAGVTDREKIVKTLQVIKDAAFNACSLDEDMLSDSVTRRYAKEAGIKKGEEFYFRLSWYFSAQHYKRLVEFVTRYEEISLAESQAEAELEAAITEEINQQSDPLGNSEYDELGGPDYAVCIYEKHIEVRAFVPGVGERLPKKNRKYIGCQGDIRWQYPLSMQSELEALGCPVVKVQELQNA